MACRTHSFALPSPAASEEPVYGQHASTIDFDLLMQIRCAFTNAERVRLRMK